MGIEIVTFGCRLNTYESEVIRDNAVTSGLADAIIFNTCAVTAEAERQARQAIRRARREHPGTRIIVTGCAAQIRPQEYGDMPEVDLVLGNEEKLKTAPYTSLRAQRSNPSLQRGTSEEWIAASPAAPRNVGMNWGEKIRVNDIMSVKETASHLVSSFEGRARAFVQVQNGCNHRCTFCIIPYGRGNSRSVPVGEIVTQVRSLVEHGYKEVVITGVDISDYGKDLPGEPTLGAMLTRLLTLVPELPRLRLSSIDAVEVDEDLYRLIGQEPRLMPHIHISLQAGDDMILKRMKRRHSRADALAFCARVRKLRPDVVFGADIIAGFPTETEEMFGNSLRLVEEADITYLHVFPYSARVGTPAARMPQVAKEIRKERAGRLRNLGDAQLKNYYKSWVGRDVMAIVEQDKTTTRSEHFVPVSLTTEQEPGALVKLRVTGMNEQGLTGSIA